MIYVTVGTHHYDFARLIRAADEYAIETKQFIVVQTGLSKALPTACYAIDFAPRDTCLALQRSARVIVCHAGIGAVMDALEAQRPFVVVPRLKRFGEHNTDHQLELARAVEDRGWARAVYDIDRLAEAIEKPLPPPTDYAPARAPLVERVRLFVEKSAGKFHQAPTQRENDLDG